VQGHFDDLVVMDALVLDDVERHLRINDVIENLGNSTDFLLRVFAQALGHVHVLAFDHQIHKQYTSFLSPETRY